jgi:Secretion system C-terminal sorting domain
MKKMMVILMCTLFAFAAFANQGDTELSGQTGIEQNIRSIALQDDSREIDEFGDLHDPVLMLQFTEGPQNSMMGIAWDGQYYWTINGGNTSGLLNRYSEDGIFLGVTRFSMSGRGIVFNPIDGLLYMSTFGGSIHRVDDPYTDYATTEVCTGVMQSPQASLGMSWDGTLLYDFYRGVTEVHDFFTFDLLDSYDDFSYGYASPGGNCSIIADTDYLYTIDAYTDELFVYNISDGSHVDTYVLPFGNDGYSLSIANNMIFYNLSANMEIGTWYGYSLRDWTDSISLTLTPTISIIPSSGGDVVYDAHLLSTIDLSANGLDYETYATMPSGQVVGPLVSHPWNLAPFMDTIVNGMTQHIPDTAPRGYYNFEGRAGVVSNPAYTITDNFTFYKRGSGEDWEEDFEDGLAQDFNFDTGNASYTIDDGYCKFDQVLGLDWGSGSYEGATFGDVTVSSTLELIQTQGYSVGMLWRGNGPLDEDYDGYALYISDGAYSVWVYLDGNSINRIGWTESQFINSGVGAVNDLEIVTLGNFADFYANGNYVGSWSDGNYTEGYVGIVASYTNETWFDDIDCSTGGPAPDMVADLGELETVLRDHMGIVITDPAEIYTPGRAFDRSKDIIAEFKSIPKDLTTFDFITSGDAGAVATPTQFEMVTAFPNPFNPRTALTINLPDAAELSVKVFNVAGQQVAVLANGQFNAGNHALTFDASGMASGLYLVRATMPGQLDQVQKVMLVR